MTPTDSAKLHGALNVRIQDLCPDKTTSHGGLPGDSVVLASVASVLGADEPHAPSGRQLLMSLVAKFAQAALRNTST